MAEIKTNDDFIAYMRDFVRKNPINFGDADIFAKPNRDGIRISINHPRIRPLYEKYVDFLHDNGRIRARIVTKAQRQDFDNWFYLMMQMQTRR